MIDVVGDDKVVAMATIKPARVINCKPKPRQSAGRRAGRRPKTRPSKASIFTGCPLPPTSQRFPRHYDIICRLACGTLNVSLEQTMLSGTLSHPNVAHALSYR